MGKPELIVDWILVGVALALFVAFCVLLADLCLYTIINSLGLAPAYM